MNSFWQHSFLHAVMITGFVTMMMVLIEYINISSKGIWQQGLRGERWKQYALSALLGVTPGCLGAFVVVSLYSHREVTLGAVVVAMIATSGDEAFVMLLLMPKQSLLVFVILLFLGLIAGYITDKIFKQKLQNCIGYVYQPDSFKRHLISELFDSVGLVHRARQKNNLQIKITV